MTTEEKRSSVSYEREGTQKPETPEPGHEGKNLGHGLRGTS